MRTRQDCAEESVVPPVPKYRSVWTLLASTTPVAWLKLIGGSPSAPTYFRGLVRWLASRQILAKAGLLIMEFLYDAELDHRDWMRAELHDLRKTHPNPEAPFWFDYVADIGDGQLANYNLACLLLGPLELLPEDESVTVEGTRRRRLRIASSGERDLASNTVALERGTFLLVGGDTAYHVADVEALRQRVQHPFEWARRRLQNAEAPEEDPHQPPWIFALPGNHDLYDSIRGLNQFFTKPHYEKANDRTRIADFNRVQTASYVALDLPHDFRLVAMHSEGGKIDHRQGTLVHAWVREGEDAIRKRLIMATSQPSTVHDTTSKTSRRPFLKAGLPRPFLGTDQFPSGDAIHLDLSGDTHHYARYVRAGHENFQSVVAGGGAFAHPTCTVRAKDKLPGWPPEPKILYPTPQVSQSRTFSRLLRPNWVMAGGLVWVIGGFVALLGQHALVTARWFTGDSLPIGARLGRVAAWGGVSVLDWVGLVISAVACLCMLPSLRELHRAQDALAMDKPLPLLRPLHYWVVTLAVLGAVGVEIASLCEHWRSASDFENDLSLVPLALFVIVAVVCGMWAPVCGKLRVIQDKFRTTSWRDHVPGWCAGALAATSVAIGVMTSVPADHSLGRLGSALILLTLIGGLGAAAAAGGGIGQSLWRRAVVAVAAVTLALAVLVIPTALVTHAECAALAAAVGATWLLAVASSFVFERLPVSNRTLLVVLAIALYVVLLVLPCWVVAGSGFRDVLFNSAPIHPNGWLTVLVGALLTCVWFAAYLALALAFNCHNNEVGVTVRVDHFCHFIRFKLEPSKITGYVIGVARLADPNAKLEPMLIEEFTVTPLTPDPRV